MPGVMPVYDVKAKDDDERKKRTEGINDYWKWRDGDHPQSLKVRQGDADDNIVENLCGQLVDDLTEFLGVPELRVKLDDTKPRNEKGKNPAEETLELLLEDTDFAGLAQDTIESGLVSGHNFLRVDMDDDEPMAGILDPRFMSVFWDMTRAGLKKRLLWYRMTWEIGGDDKGKIGGNNPQMRQDIVPDWLFNNEPQREPEWWAILEYRLKGSTWDLEGSEQWLHPFAPVVDWKNKRRPHEYYGHSELFGAQRMNKAINFIASNTGRIIKFHAHPKTTITGAQGEQIKIGVDRLIELPAGAEVKNLEMQSDLSSSMAFLARLEARFFSERRMVDMAAIKDKAGVLTNFGLRILYLNTIKLIEDKRALYGGGFIDTYQRLMALAGHDVQLECDWTDPLPINRKELLDAAQQEIDIGIVSKKTVSKDLGRNFDDEQNQRQEEAANAIDLAAATMTRMSERGVIQPANNASTNGNNGNDADE